MTDKRREAFESWLKAEHPARRSPYTDFACVAWQASEQRLIAMLDEPKVMEAVSRAIQNSFEESKQAGPEYGYDNDAKAAIEAIKSKWGK